MENNIKTKLILNTYKQETLNLIETENTENQKKKKRQTWHH